MSENEIKKRKLPRDHEEVVTDRGVTDHLNRRVLFDKKLPPPPSLVEVDHNANTD
ncbi:hypothetical protein K9M47_04255 [Candidatus Gracilibacteria bacterium]|nr:hypothetical protein [Candidatus Gracilibacteria bacterium]